MSNQIKELRKQLRKVVQEVLPEVLTEEMLIAKTAELTQIIETRLRQLEEQVKATLHEMNERQKDVQGFLVRAVTTPAPTVKAEEPKSE